MMNRIVESVGDVKLEELPQRREGSKVLKDMVLVRRSFASSSLRGKTRVLALPGSEPACFSLEG